MPFQLPQPTTYLITPGQTTSATTPASEEFEAVLALVRRAALAGISLIQIREKLLHARVLFELATRAATLTRDTATRLLVNDRADIALAAGCDGVHLTTRSLEARYVRQMVAARSTQTDFLIGVSAHTLAEARVARDGGADFATFSPIFETPSKLAYGAPVGLDRLAVAARTLAPFPLLALGGITLGNAAQALGAGARGIAAIRLFTETDALAAIVRELRRSPN